MAFARKMWGNIPSMAVRALQELTKTYSLSVTSGDVLYLNGKWYVTYHGLLRIARRNGCAGVSVDPIPEFCNSPASRWAFKATVYKSRSCKGFVGFGDADPSSVSPLVHGAEMRVAETRAVSRALRKAYGIGICTLEEVGYVPTPPESSAGSRSANSSSNGNRSSTHVRLRDRLCLLIRQHQLDPTLVKRYASDFCGAPELREASRDQVESFITHLAEWAAKDRDGLVCKLNSYAQAEKVHP